MTFSYCESRVLKKYWDNEMPSDTQEYTRETVMLSHCMQIQEQFFYATI